MSSIPVPKIEPKTSVGCQPLTPCRSGDAAVGASTHYVNVATRNWLQAQWRSRLEVIDIKDPAHSSLEAFECRTVRE